MKYAEFKRIAMASIDIAKTTWFTLDWEQKQEIYWEMESDEELDKDSDEYKFFDDLYWKEYRARDQMNDEGCCAECGEFTTEENEGDAEHPVYVSHCKCS